MVPVMPKEYSILLDLPESLDKCPNCGVDPFRSFLRGVVQRSKLFGFRKRYCAVICDNCKEIVDYEDPNNTELLIKRALGY